MMHILQIIPHFPPEAFLIEHINALSNPSERIHISWFYLYNGVAGNCSHVGFPLKNEVGIFTRKDFTLKHRLKKKLRNLSVKEYIKHYNISQIKRLDPDIIHFQFGWALDRFSWILDELQIPYCISFRGSDIFIEPIKNPEYITRLKPYIQKANSIHAVSASVKRRVIELFDPTCEIQIINTPLKTSILNGINLLRKDIIAVGRLHWVKDYQELLLAFSYFLNTMPNVNLKIIGDGAELEKLQFLAFKLGISDNVKFLGYLNKESIYKELMKSKLFVLSSYSEGFPNALLEALAHGVNAVVPNDLAIDQIFSNGEVEMYEKFNSNDLASIMIKMYNEDAHLSINRTKKTKEIIRSKFSFETHRTQFVEFYGNILNEKNNG